MKGWRGSGEPRAVERVWRRKDDGNPGSGQGNGMKVKFSYSGYVKV